MDAPLVEQAKASYKRSNLHFKQMEGTRLDFPDGSFDVVGSFQVIEHIPEPELLTYLREIARVLGPEGVLIVSTMNLDHNKKPGAPYEKASFHEKEFTEPELQKLLEQVFPSVKVYGLFPRRKYRLMKRFKKWGLHRLGPAGWNPVRRFLEERLNTDDHELAPSVNRRAIDLIGVCAVSKDTRAPLRLP